MGGAEDEGGEGDDVGGQSEGASPPATRPYPQLNSFTDVQKGCVTLPCKTLS